MTLAMRAPDPAPGSLIDQALPKPLAATGPGQHGGALDPLIDALRLAAQREAERSQADPAAWR